MAGEKAQQDSGVVSLKGDSYRLKERDLAASRPREPTHANDHSRR